MVRPTAMDTTYLTEAIELHRAIRGAGPATSDAVLATARWYVDTVAASPSSFDAGETERALAMVAAVEADMSRRIGDFSLASDRTSERAERPRMVAGAKGKQYVIGGHVSSADRRAAFGRGTEADDFEVLDGAPVGNVDPLVTAAANRSWWLAVRRQSDWDARNAVADGAERALRGTDARRKSRNAKRAARRAR
jgi:hypothetical protein